MNKESSREEKKMAFQWKKEEEKLTLLCCDQEVLYLPAQEGCQDTVEEIEEGAYKWIRKTDKPVTEMKMTLCHANPMGWWMVPSVNYNGNGWGSGAQYSGYAFEGEPWTYAWHRVAIPACSYVESGKWGVGLFGEEKGGMSGSLWSDDGVGRQALIWPEVEGPKVLFKRSWKDPYYGTMDPQSEFVAIIKVSKSETVRQGYPEMQDFAWKYFERPIKMEKSPEEIRRLDLLFNRQCFLRRFDGTVGFVNGIHWVEAEYTFKKTETFECGWCGQNISRACHFLQAYLDTGDTLLRDQAIEVLDSWVKYSVLENGLMIVKLLCDPKNVDSIVNGDIPIELDACNLGTAATYFFKAHRLAKKCGMDKPEYLKTALGLCDFAIKTQRKNGEFAKSWFIDGTISSAHGSVGVFYTLPLFDAYEVTKEQKYLDTALSSLAFYYGEFHESGFTTAGALDSYCIDKESAAPLIRGCLMAYHATDDRKYVDWAEEVGNYLNTWLWHYTTDFPAGSMAKEIGYDTYGGTAVSAAHNAQDPYGVYYVPEYLELAKLTGKEIWRSRARALWYNGQQLLSDGSLVIRGKVRPAGSQDESVRHTRWGRTDNRYFVSSEWLINWPGTFRQVTLDMVENWDELR